jgi:hypothetical protein
MDNITIEIAGLERILHYLELRSDDAAARVVIRRKLIIARTAARMQWEKFREEA